MTLLVTVGAVHAWAQPTELFISEYIEGSSNNKAIEIYNGTASAINLATGNYVLQQYFNGAITSGLNITLTGTVAAGDVYVVAHSSASATILGQADQTSGSGFFNGDDAVVLRKGGTGGTIVDVLGQIGLDPGTEWGSGLTSTADNTLRRKTSICAGDTNGSDAFDPSVEWDGFATDTFAGLGAHTAACAGDAAPTVTATTPASAASCIAPSANITVTFSEAVNAATGAWFTINCTSSGAHTAAESGGPTTFTLNPDADFSVGETCTVTIVALQVSDQDATDPPDAMAANHSWSFSTPGGGLTPIHDIQGSGVSSPLSGIVTTRGIVTGVRVVSSGNRGFFIQAPDADADADPLTSEGILVYTGGSVPAEAVVGNLVEVRGTISEYVPSADLYQPPLTELTSPSICVIDTGQPLPAAIPLTATFPDPTGPFDQLERVEGMRVSVASLTVSAPSNGQVNESAATVTSWGEFYGVVTGIARPFREPGIQHPDPATPGTIPPIPRWDTNPEIIRVDSDALVGATTLDVGTGAVVTGLVGPLDYLNRRYTVMQDPGIVPGVSGGPSATAVQAPTADEVTVASFNAQRFFDTVPDSGTSDPVLTSGAFDGRLDKVSLAVRDQLRFPDIIAFMEVEHLSTLQAIAARISSDALAAPQSDPLYEAYLFEGNDIGGIDVGFLVKTAPVSGSTPRVEAVAVTQEGGSTTWTDPSDNASRLLNDRPPLVLEAIVHFADGRTYPITVIAVHQRSFNGIDDPSPDGLVTSAVRVQQKRREQSKFLAGVIDARQVADPLERIVVVGDFNAFEFNDGYVDVMGLISGSPLPDDQTVVAGDDVDLVGSDLTVLTDTVAAADRYSYTFDGCAQSLDHAVANAPLLASAIDRIEHARIGADFPEIARVNTTTPIRLSDHDPLVLYLALDADGDGIADSIDPCDDALAPAFAVTGQTPTSLSGTVEDCSGVASVVLAPGSVNLLLVVGGNPGDPSRTWTVSLADPYEPGSGGIVAADGYPGTEETTFAIALQELLPVPALDGAGLALLVLLLAVAGALVLARKSALG